MRTILSITLGVALLLGIGAAPAQAEVVWDNEPPLPYNQLLTFVDTVAATTGPDRLAAWRYIRDTALSQWGIPYAVSEEWSGTAIPITDGHGEEVAYPGLIRIARNESSVCQSYGGWYASVEGGIAVVCLWRFWFKDDNRAAMRGQLNHETGHAFGLGHSTTGVMSGSLLVSAEEAAAVQTYYA